MAAGMPLMGSMMDIDAQRSKDTVGHFVNNYNSAKEYSRSKKLMSYQSNLNQHNIYTNYADAPSAQMAGLRKAGLNPILAYSKGGPSIPQNSVSGGSAPKQEFKSNATSNIQGGMLASAQATLLQQQALTEQVRQKDIAAAARLKGITADATDPFSTLIKTSDIAGSARTVGNRAKKMIDDPDNAVQEILDEILQRSTPIKTHKQRNRANSRKWTKSKTLRQQKNRQRLLRNN